MKSWFAHALCGIAVALGARFLLPGHGPQGHVFTIVLGAIGGMFADWFGRRAGLYAKDQVASWVMSSLGSMALMLVYGVLGQ